MLKKTLLILSLIVIVLSTTLVFAEKGGEGFIGRFWPDNKDDKSKAVKEVPAHKQLITLSFAPIVKASKPAVVSISALQQLEQQSQHPFFDDEFMSFFFGSRRFGDFSRQQLERSLGSGVIIDPSGIIITCNHVVRNSKDIEVKLDDNQIFKAEVVLNDIKNDLAVIKIKQDKKKKLELPFISLGNSRDINVGDLVLAIGNPFGVGQTVTNGIVSALARGVNGQVLMQTDAPINPGNSGGALIDMNGNLIAIPNAIFSKTGAFHGIGFAIPIALVKPLLAAAKMDGKFVYPWDGLTIKTMIPDEIEAFGFDKPVGVLVASAHPLSPAIKAGVKIGDIIIGVNGIPIYSMEDYLVALQDRELGREIDFKVYRKGQQVSIKFKLIAPPEDEDPEIKTLVDMGPFSGVRVANISPALTEKYNLPEAHHQGVIIIEVPSTSGVGFAMKGVQPGDIIEEVNDKKVTSAKQLLALIKQGVRFMVIRRGGNIIRIHFQ